MRMVAARRRVGCLLSLIAIGWIAEVTQAKSISTDEALQDLQEKSVHHQENSCFHGISSDHVVDPLLFFQKSPSQHLRKNGGRRRLMMMEESKLAKRSQPPPAKIDCFLDAIGSSSVDALKDTVRGNRVRHFQMLASVFADSVRDDDDYIVDSEKPLPTFDATLTKLARQIFTERDTDSPLLRRFNILAALYATGNEEVTKEKLRELMPKEDKWNVLSSVLYNILRTIDEQNERRTALVSGGGPNGVVAALLARSRGWTTVVVEKRSQFTRHVFPMMKPDYWNGILGLFGLTVGDENKSMLLRELEEGLMDILRIVQAMGPAVKVQILQGHQIVYIKDASEGKNPTAVLFDVQNDDGIRLAREDADIVESEYFGQQADGPSIMEPMSERMAKLDPYLIGWSYDLLIVAEGANSPTRDSIIFKGQSVFKHQLDDNEQLVWPVKEPPGPAPINAVRDYFKEVIKEEMGLSSAKRTDNIVQMNPRGNDFKKRALCVFLKFKGIAATKDVSSWDTSENKLKRSKVGDFAIAHRDDPTMCEIPMLLFNSKHITGVVDRTQNDPNTGKPPLTVKETWLEMTLHRKLAEEFFGTMAAVGAIQGRADFATRIETEEWGFNYRRFLGDLNTVPNDAGRLISELQLFVGRGLDANTPDLEAPHTTKWSLTNILDDLIPGDLAFLPREGRVMTRGGRSSDIAASLPAWPTRPGSLAISMEPSGRLKCGPATTDSKCNGKSWGDPCVTARRPAFCLPSSTEASKCECTANQNSIYHPGVQTALARTKLFTSHLVEDSGCSIFTIGAKRAKKVSDLQKRAVLVGDTARESIFSFGNGLNEGVYGSFVDITSLLDNYQTDVPRALNTYAIDFGSRIREYANLAALYVQSKQVASARFFPGMGKNWYEGAKLWTANCEGHITPVSFDFVRNGDLRVLADRFAVDITVNGQQPALPQLPQAPVVVTSARDCGKGSPGDCVKENDVCTISIHEKDHAGVCLIEGEAGRCTCYATISLD